MLLAQPLPFHDAAPSFLPAGTIFPDISNYLPVKFPQEKQNHGSDIEQGLVPQTTGGSLLNGVLTAVSAFGAEVEVRRAGRWEGKVGCSVASLGAQKAGGGARPASHVDGTVMPSGRLVPFFTELNTAPVQGSEGLKEAGQWQRSPCKPGCCLIPTR